MYVVSASGTFRPWEITDGFVGTDALQFAELENVMRKGSTKGRIVQFR
jgi:hypothetical protein